MQTRNALSIETFDKILSDWQGPGQVEKLAPYAYRWVPPAVKVHPKRKIGLCLQAITHGDEVGGIQVLIELLNFLQAGLIAPKMPLGFSLGNIEASIADRRFLEADLNRSFGTKDLSTKEAKRSLELMPMLSESDFFLDFHQTIEASIQPFFIFPYAAKSLAFARAAHSEVHVVTHWGKPFSLDGMCTDEFVNFKGGVGITIELGQKGFEAYQTSVGVQAALGAIRYAEDVLSGKIIEAAEAGVLYTWKAIVLYEEGMDLKEGLFNFQPVKKGDVLGVHGPNPLLCEDDGYLLFPKYQRDPNAPRPREIYRVAKRISAEVLGQDGVVGV